MDPGETTLGFECILSLFTEKTLKLTRFTRSSRHLFDGGSVEPVVSGDF